MGTRVISIAPALHLLAHRQVPKFLFEVASRVRVTCVALQAAEAPGRTEHKTDYLVR